MRFWITLCLVASSYACPSYRTDDNKEIPLGCVEPLQNSGTTPWEPTDIGTRFIIFDQSNPRVPQQVLQWNASLDQTDSLFTPGTNLKFVIHGFLESSENSTVEDLKNAMLQQEPNTKVILVDWGNAAFSTATDTKRYPQAANNALMVGRVVACFVQRVMSTYRIPAESVHIVGHSLGAQIMGLATAWLTKNFRIRIASGTASDAASPLLTSNGISPDRKNVDFMLAIHTSSKLTNDSVHDDSLGVYKAFADVDLYPNRGITKQPACRDSSADPRSVESIFCSHVRGYIYLTDLINSCSDSCDFQATICKNEQEAVRGTCSSGNVNVCSFIKSRRAGAAPDRRDTVLTFETNSDQLPIRCEGGEQQYGSR